MKQKPYLNTLIYERGEIMMKLKSQKLKLILIFSVIILLIVIVAGALIYHNSLQGKRPFENLTADEVKSISLYDYRGDSIYTFNEDEKTEIVNLLNGIEIGKEDNQEYNGGFCPEFRLEKTDGTITEFGTNANFWLDGQRYEVPDNNISLIELRNLHSEYFKEHFVPYSERGL